VLAKLVARLEYPMYVVTAAAQGERSGCLVGFGTQTQGRRHAIYFLWSSQRVQDYLALLRGGKAESHDLPADLMTFCPEYAEHLNSHRQRMVEGRKGDEKREWYKLSGWADHLYDCECELTVMMIRSGALKTPE